MSLEHEQNKLRILAVSALWQGANDYAFVRAFRRMGHSVRAVNEAEYSPSWRSRSMRIVRRMLRPQFVKEFNRALLREARDLRPDLLFVFKGALLTGETLRAIREMGAICIQFYPDTGFQAHSSHLLAAIPEYDWFFSTKSEHVEKLRASHGYDRVSFLPHGFDPETHKPVVTNRRDVEDYACDVSFIGSISNKKKAAMEVLLEKVGDLDVAIWGPADWGGQGGAVARAYRGSPVFGLEYAKAIQLSKINLGLLFEGNDDGSKPDEITARTFEIPGVGGFMLHERTAEAENYFEDGKEVVFFDGPSELVDKIDYYLANDDERRAIARSAHLRCMNSGYSVDHRAAKIISKYHELIVTRDTAGTEIYE